MDEFEELVAKEIAEYGAPAEITRELTNFLIDSGNARTIGMLYHETYMAESKNKAIY